MIKKDFYTIRSMGVTAGFWGVDDDSSLFLPLFLFETMVAALNETFTQ
jgi:hypothetical protein